MEAKVFQGLQVNFWINQENVARKPGSTLTFLRNKREQWFYGVPSACHLFTRNGRFHRPLVLKVSCSSENSPASLLQSGTLPTYFDETKILEKKSEEVQPYLNGKCIYLVGMMGSGKTTVGKVLSETLGYSFCDCDKLIEEAVGGHTVAEIFKLYGESCFRDNETQVLHKLSLMHRVIVSTGGGAVVRPINWRHMQKGISVWLDVPLEALARRITAVGTASRPLLHHESGDPYTKTMKRLTTLFEERGEAYANATVRVSLENMAIKFGFEDLCDLTPTLIAIEVLQQINDFLTKQ